MASTNEISVENIVKTYGLRNKIVAIDNVTFSVKSGTCTSLVGPNGAGKTTLLKVVSGLTSRYQGKVSVNGRVSLSPEVSVNFPFMDAVENILYFSKVVDRNIDPTNILKEVNLVPRGQQAYSYSKGMKRKLDIARALSLGAKSILMDEPFDGLDPGASDELVNIINSLKNEGITFLISSHDLHRLTDISDNVVFLKKGRVGGIRDLRVRNRLIVNFAENSNLAVDLLEKMGCIITNSEMRELHFIPSPRLKTWEIIGNLISNGVEVTGVSNETLDSDYRRIYHGNMD
jgi:ABC-type multidrug transport system ATPase subunit